MDWDLLRRTIIAAICEQANELKRLRQLRRTIEKLHSETVTVVPLSDRPATEKSGGERE